MVETISLVFGLVLAIVFTAITGILKQPIRNLKAKGISWQLIRLFPKAAMVIVWIFLLVITEIGKVIINELIKLSLKIIKRVFNTISLEMPNNIPTEHTDGRINLFGIGTNSNRLYTHRDIEHYKSKVGWL